MIEQIAYYVIPGLKYRPPIKTRFERDEIIQVVLDYYKVSLDQAQAQTRKREVCLARQICMTLLKRHTKLSLKSIGAHFGGRDHTTVIHARDTIKDLCDTDERIREDIRIIEDRLFYGY